jgi:hypothetical protein
MNDAQDEEMQERIDTAIRDFSLFFEEQNIELFRPMIEQINRSLDFWTRQLFAVRICDLGLPVWFADFIAFHCPERWLPYGWIHQNDS